MTQLTVSQLVILEKLSHLHAIGAELRIPKSHLKLAFPLNNCTIDFNLAKQVLDPFGFSMIGSSNSDEFRNARWVVFTKHSGSDFRGTSEAA